MRKTRSRGIVMGLGLLGIGALVGLAQPVSAAPRARVKQERKDVKAARKNVEEERKDLRKADTRPERREERRELTAAERRLQNEKQDLQRAQLRRAQLQKEQARREQLRREQLRREQLRREQLRREQLQRQRQSVQNRNYRPGYQSRSNYQNRNYRTLEGRIVDDLKGDSFVLRRDNGERVRVYLNNEPDRLDPGDRVRVNGYFSNGIFRARSFDILRNR